MATLHSHSYPILTFLLISHCTPAVQARRRGFFTFAFIGGPPALTAVFVILSIILFAGVIFGAYSCYRYQQRKNWNRRIEEAEEAVLQEELKNKTEIDNPIRTVTYNASYTERNGDPCTTKGTLDFKKTDAKFLTTSTDGKTASNTSDCLSISGKGMNSNGSFVIKRGRISPSGRCCWVEERDGPKESCHFFKEPQQILVTGKLASGQPKFTEGRWASYHPWGEVTDGQISQLSLSNKVGGREGP